MFIKLNNQEVSIIQPCYQGKELIIAIDSSKTNTGITVGDKYGRELDVFDINGSKDGTSEQDVLLLCQKQRKALYEILYGSKPIIVGIENIITKKYGDRISGIDVHESRFKITSIFMSFIFLFQDKFNITPELVNNWTWKSTVLPQEFRTKEHHKGSLDYFKAIGSPYRAYTDDATDSVCIFRYLCKEHNVKENGIEISEPEVMGQSHCIKIVSVKREVTSVYIKFIYNKILSLEQNCIVIANTIKQKELGYADVDTEDIKLEDIYKYCYGSFSQREEKIRVVCWRKA